MPVIALLIMVLLAASARAADVDALQSKVEAARGQATAIAADLREKQGRLAVVEQEAAVAAGRERRLSDLLAGGEERAADLAEEVAGTERQLAEERSRLRRARGVLAERLVAIYMNGSPDAAGIVLGSNDFASLLTNAEYLRRIEESDSQLAARVKQLRDEVRHELELVAELKSRVDAHNSRLAAARSQISSVRVSAEATASQLRSIAAARASSLVALKSNIGGWVDDIEVAEAASRSAAEATVERWLGGPFSIPTYIVLCESGGNYSALNPSSGAGGAYQIIPSTWALYGGKGAPHEASKAEQDRIAAEIWADSGASAWVCAG
jgi:peptidoglycan hydrolase CwlO-like protein